MRTEFENLNSGLAEKLKFVGNDNLLKNTFLEVQKITSTGTLGLD